MAYHLRLLGVVIVRIDLDAEFSLYEWEELLEDMAVFGGTGLNRSRDAELREASDLANGAVSRFIRLAKEYGATV